MAGGDDPLQVGDDAAVVDKHVDVVLRRQQGADIAVQDEVRLPAALDRLGDTRDRPHGRGRGPRGRWPAATRQGVDVGVNARVGGVRHGGIQPSVVVPVPARS